MSVRLLLALVACAVLSGCGTYSVRAPYSIASDPQIKRSGTGEGMDTYVSFNAALQTAQADPLNGQKNGILLHEGMQLVSSSCMRYFTRLGMADQQLRFAGKETALTGALIASAQGLANATAKSIANTAGIFGFATASLNAYSDTYIFSPDVRAVQALVVSALDSSIQIGNKIVQDAMGHTQPLTYTDVSNFLLTMEANCQPHGIRDLVTRAVANQQAVPTFLATGPTTVTGEPQIALTTNAAEVAAKRASEDAIAAIRARDALSQKLRSDTSDAAKTAKAAAEELLALREKAAKSAEAAKNLILEVRKTHAAAAAVAFRAAAEKAAADSKALEIEAATAAAATVAVAPPAVPAPATAAPPAVPAQATAAPPPAPNATPSLLSVPINTRRQTLTLQQPQSPPAPAPR